MSSSSPQDSGPAVLTPGMVATQQFGSESVARTAEVAQGGMATHVQAAVQAKYIMAERRPRDEDTYRARLLKDCQRPSFVASAMYRVPRAGGHIDGLSIRFAEAAVRAMGNMWCESFSIYEDSKKRITRIRVVDLESNTTYERDITVQKLVERSRPGPRGHVEQRVNSNGQVVFIVKSTDEEMTTKENALASKALRTLILRIVPGWLQDECTDAIKETRQRQDAVDPDAAKRRIIDAFTDLRVMPAQLVEYLGHAVEHCTPQEITDLRGIMVAVRDGETSWADIMGARTAVRGQGEEDAKAKPKTRAEEIMEKIKPGEKDAGSKA